MRFPSHLLFIFLSVFSSCVYAVMPVFDEGAIAQAVMLVDKASKQLDKLDLQLNQLNEIRNFNIKNQSGARGTDFLFLHENDVKKRTWTHDSWLDAMHAKSGNKTDAFNQTQNRYKNLYNVADPQAIHPSRKNHLSRTFYEESANINRVALSASEESYNQINDRIAKLHEMLLKVSDNPDEKAAIDLNTRIVAEIGFIQLEILRQQTIQNQLLAMTSQQTINGMSDQSRFMKFTRGS